MKPICEPEIIIGKEPVNYSDMKSNFLKGLLTESQDNLQLNAYRFFDFLLDYLEDGEFKDDVQLFIHKWEDHFPEEMV